MYRLFSLFWSGQRAQSFLDAHTRYRADRGPANARRRRLPREYVAVKFYAARSLPDTPDVRRTLAWFVDSLAERTNVVLLDTGLVLDEHADYPFGPSGRVVSAKPWMTPSNNLGVQTQIIAGAQAFVGTCGSVAWLAPMLGVNASASVRRSEAAARASRRDAARLSPRRCGTFRRARFAGAGYGRPPVGSRLGLQASGIKP